MSVRPLITAAALLAALFACGGDAAKNVNTPTPPTQAVSPPAAPPGSLWWAGHESGDLSEWSRNSGGGEFDSGIAVATISRDVAHSGRYAARLTITAPPESGTRLFRWREGETAEAAYYSVWYYLPQPYEPTWWNIFQFKSRSGSLNDPFWYLQLEPGRDGALYLGLTWWDQLWPNRGVEGPHVGERGGRTYRQTVRPFRIGQWVHVEAFLRQSSGFTGQVIVWQDEVEVFNQSDIKTRYAGADGTNQWSVNNYAGGISPSPSIIYIDDAAISTTRIQQ
jgi:Polysaccharide lyase